MNRLGIALTVALALVLVGTGTADAAPKNPCGPDVARHCQGIKKGGGRIDKCLDEHKEELSDACRALREGTAFVDTRRSCERDVKLYCKGIKKGGSRVTKCLDEHVEKLSEGCRALREKRGLVVSKFRAACTDDVKQFCADVEPGEARVTKCLAKNKTAISAPCLTQIDDAMERHMALRGPCAVDATKFCPATDPGEGRLRACLLERKKELNLACGDYLSRNKLR